MNPFSSSADGDSEYQIELRIALIRKYGSQIRAARPLRIDESRLSRLVRGHSAPTANERKKLAAALGVDYFAEEGARAQVG